MIGETNGDQNLQTSGDEFLAGKKKKVKTLRTFGQSDIQNLEKLLTGLETRTRVGKKEALSELHEPILRCVRNGWRPIDIAKVLKDEGHMAAVTQTDVLEVLHAEFENGNLTAQELQAMKLRQVMTFKKK